MTSIVFLVLPLELLQLLFVPQTSNIESPSVHQSMKFFISLMGIPVAFKHSITFNALISASLNTLIPLGVRSSKGMSPSDKKLHGLLTECSYEAQKITMKLNTSFHSREEIVEIFSELTGNKVDSTFMCFPPFYMTSEKHHDWKKRVF